jgi:nucleotide-binding universal stress UspA family protein
MQIKKILVPTDFSECAENALEAAIKIATVLNAEIIILNAYSMPYTGTNVMIDISDVLKERSYEDLNKLLHKLKQSGKDKNISIHIVSEYGPAAEIIASVADTQGVDLVIMGTKGAGSLASKLLGSITSNALAKVKKPILVVPEKAIDFDIKNIVLASDLHTQYSEKLNALIVLAKAFSARVNILYVNTHAEEKPAIAKAIEGVKLNALLRDVDHDFVVTDNYDAEEGINQYAATHQTDVLAVIPHHYGFFERLFHRSISKKLSLHSNIPLLVLN